MIQALHGLELPFTFIVSVNLGKPDTTFHTSRSACLWNQAELLAEEQHDGAVEE